MNKKGILGYGDFGLSVAINVMVFLMKRGTLWPGVLNKRLESNLLLLSAFLFGGTIMYYMRTDRAFFVKSIGMRAFGLLSAITLLVFID